MSSCYIAGMCQGTDLGYFVGFSFLIANKKVINVVSTMKASKEEAMT